MTSSGSGTGSHPWVPIPHQLHALCWTVPCWVGETVVWGSAGHGMGWHSFPGGSCGHPPSCFFHSCLFLFPLIYTVFNQTVVYLEVNMKPICLSLKRPITVYIQRQQGAWAPANFEDCGSDAEAGWGAVLKVCSQDSPPD